MSRDADETAIENAYDGLFDRYEPQAYAGDAEATQILDGLNRARDILLDPLRRAALDARLANAPVRPNGEDFAISAVPRSHTLSRSYRTPDPGPWATGRGRSRGSGSNSPRSVASHASAMPLLFIIVGFVALVAVAVTVFFISRNVNSSVSGVGAWTGVGQVVATVNGQPIYQGDLDARYEKDKEQQIGDPLLVSIMAEGDITATRVLEVIRQDALDKLINFEVIMQQAKKEQLYPDAQGQKQLIQTAKTADVKAGQTFEQSLQEHGLTEEQYNRNVISGAVYKIMASKYMPAKGTEAERQDAFIKWMCKTRQSYDVKIDVTFAASKDNRPCSSGVPSDIPLTSSLGSPPTLDQGLPPVRPTQQATLAPGAPRPITTSAPANATPAKP